MDLAPKQAQTDSGTHTGTVEQRLRFLCKTLQVVRL